MSSHVRADAGSKPKTESGAPNHMNAASGDVSKPDMDAGLQPIDAMMLQRGISNHDLVAALTGSGLTHKQVAKARRGRKLTLHLQDKIVSALNRAAGSDAPLRREDCFTYRGR